MTRGSYFVSTCLALSLGLTQLAVAAEQPYQVAWTAQIGTNDYDLSRSVAVDAAGNTYISGATKGSLGGANTGDFDAFLTKFDPSGTELWSRQVGTSSYDYSHAVAVDAAGNAYISGYTYGSLGGSRAGARDAFLTKFSPSGTELWTTQIGTMSHDRSYSIAIDAAGNAYITGTTGGSLGGVNAGGNDAFLSKFGPSGAKLWTTQIGSTDDDISLSLAVDAAGNTYITGYTEGSLDGANAGMYYYDAFLSKFDPSGTELWSRQVGTASYDEAWSVAVDAAGNAYITGYTQGDLRGTKAGSSDVFLIKFDPSGTELWSTQFGTPSDDKGASVAVDAVGNAYISGFTNGSLGGPNAGDYDAFLSKFNPSGAELWTTQIGTTNLDLSNSVAMDSAGNVYMSGLTWGSLGESNAGGVSDAFLIKYAIPEPASVAVLAFGFPALLRRR